MQKHTTADLQQLEKSELITLIDDYKAKENKIKEVFTEIATTLGFVDASTGKLKPEVNKENLGFNDVLKIMDLKLSSIPMMLMSEERRDDFFKRFSAIKKLGPIIEEYAGN